MNDIQTIIKQSIEVKEKISNNDSILLMLAQIINKISDCYRKGGKVLFCGNGGSAADAQHLAAELSGRFYIDRRPLYAEALHTNSSYVTAVANDYGYDNIYSRLIDGVGRQGDILICLTTSGKSKNILKAIEMAHNKGMITICLTGEAVDINCYHLINVPSNDTPRVQEAHIMLGHIICEGVENILFGR